MENQDNQISRRDFVAAATAAVAACGAFCSMCDHAEAADAAPAAPVVEKVDIGTLADYPKDGVYDKFGKSNKLFIIRNDADGKLYASTAVCTHKNAPLTVVQGNIVCKKHGSKFSEFGTVTKGPAKVSLSRYAISEDDKKHLIVDTTKSFGEKDWDKDGASIKLPSSK